jgi:oxygen-dependent protoporphyrinogen oxidase
VIGAGISGLTCAYALKKRGIDVLILEAGDSPGGMIRSIHEGGYLFETGPQSFSTTPQLTKLINDLGLGSELVIAPQKAPRYILVHGNQLKPVPLSPLAFLGSSLLKWSTKFSILRDAFSKSFPPKTDESIADFVRRKFKTQLLDLLVGPFVSGIFAGDPERISLRAVFPTLHEAEQSSGSILRGMKAVAKKRKGPRAKPSLASFRQGNQALPKSLAEKLGDALCTGVRVSQVVKMDEGGFTLVAGDMQFHSGNLVVTTPTFVTAELLRRIAPAAAEALFQIEYAPVAVVSLGYRRSEVAHSLQGFGFLVPSNENLCLLGTVWNSSLFQDRAESQNVILTSFIGGAMNPDSAFWPAEDLVDQVHSELTPILGLKSRPIASRVTAYSRAIPQYNLGHLERLATIRTELAKVPGLHLTGNYLKGPAIGACIEHAQSVADCIRIG